MSDKKTHTFHVHGMHCRSCVVLTETELVNHPSVSSAKSYLHTRTVEVCGDFGERASEEVAAELTSMLKKHGYSLSTEPEKKKKWEEFTIAVPVAVLFAAAFVLLQKLGIVNLVNAGAGVGYGTAFLIGLVASLSTCMAVVGGLVLSMSASFAKAGDRTVPQALFHVGRIAAFFVLGGIIGAAGSVFTLGAAGTAIVGLVIGAVMLLLGLNLLDVFHFTKRLQPALPGFFSRHAIGLTKLNHALTPLLVGVLTFFLPCGFTQSMQIYTLGTGSFLTGGLTMLFFALGTFPVLALLSFSSWRIERSAKSGVFFKSAGLVVILFALFNVLNSLAVIGVIPPLFNF